MIYTYIIYMGNYVILNYPGLRAISHFDNFYAGAIAADSI